MAEIPPGGALDSAGQPMERVEKAGRQGWKFADGAILWDDGEKEVPTSGLSDAAKRAEALAAAGGGPVVLKEGVSDADMAGLQAQLAPLADPAAVLRRRKDYAKEVARKRPAKSREEESERVERAPKSLDELTNDARREIRKLLDVEIDRCEELKTLAGSSGLILMQAGERVAGPNPPMRLHETVLAALKSLELGEPQKMLDALNGLRAWSGSLSEPVPTPIGPPAVPPGKGTRVAYGGGQPIEDPGVPDVIIPPASGGTGTGGP